MTERLNALIVSCCTLVPVMNGSYGFDRSQLVVLGLHLKRYDHALLRIHGIRRAETHGFGPGCCSNTQPSCSTRFRQELMTWYNNSKRAQGVVGCLRWPSALTFPFERSPYQAELRDSGTSSGRPSILWGGDSITICPTITIKHVD